MSMDTAVENQDNCEKKTPIMNKSSKVIAKLP